MNHYTSLSLLQKELKTGITSCEQQVNHCLQKIKSRPTLNAFIEVFEEEALAKAKELDQRIKHGKVGNLYGLVIGLKDNLCYKGHTCQAASKILSGFKSLYTATAVQRLIDQDAIIIGRLNCDEFGMGSTNENSSFDPVLNNHDESRVAGGSSGGCAVAVSAGLCHASLGSDTGGSIRTPASFCGVVGLKPTYGRISRYGLIAYASSFDQIGIISNNIEDTTRILAVIAGKDEYDSTVADNDIPIWNKDESNQGKRKIAYITDALNHPGLDTEIKNKLEQTLESWVKAGHEVTGIDFPYLDYMVPAYYTLTTAEASSNLARYDGVHFGNSNEHAQTIQTLNTKTRSAGFGNEVKRRIMLGTFVLSSGYYDAYYEKAQKVRQLISDKTQEILENHDFIVLPTTPTVAFPLGEKTKNPIEMYLGDVFTVQANLSGLPSISLPFHKNSIGLPFGIQLMANKFQEEQLLQFSQYLMEAKQF